MTTKTGYFLTRLTPAERRVLKAYKRQREQFTKRPSSEAEGVRAGIALLKDSMKASSEKP